MIQRKAYRKLQEWKNAKNRKPLLVRGARQVGKTTLIREFSKEYDTYLELNLEKEADKNIFRSDNIDNILNAAYLQKGITPGNGKTLLFIDEIQESPEAIKTLRYFYEDKPELYVIAAGSLLEFALGDVPGFPVGRIEYLYLHPLNFIEYLGAVGNKIAVDTICTVPIPEYAHETLLSMFHDYAIVGGMPEIADNYRNDKNIASLAKIYDQLWQSFKDDIEKYAKNDTDKKILRHVINTAPNESARIKFEGFGNSNYRSREVGEAFRSLDLAKLIRLVYPSTNLEPPIKTDFRKRPRLQFLDTGILNHTLNMQAEMININDMNSLHRGRITEHIIYQELISIHEDLSFKPHFWVRESKNSNSEVDLIYQSGKYIIPIEIKSGKQGKMKSLHQFVERTNHPYAMRMHAGKYEVERVTTPGGTPYLLMNLPYYLGTKIPEYAEYFVKHYTLTQ